MGGNAHPDVVTEAAAQPAETTEETKTLTVEDILKKQFELPIVEVTHDGDGQPPSVEWLAAAHG